MTSHLLTVLRPLLWVADWVYRHSHRHQPTVTPQHTIACHTCQVTYRNGRWERQ